MSNKKKNKKPYRSLLEEPLLGADGSSGSENDVTDIPTNDFIAALEEDDSLSDVPERVMVSSEETYDDGEPEEYEAESGEEQMYLPAPGERLVGGITTFMMALLIGGSLVFWWAIGRNLLRTPFALADSTQMKVLLASCLVYTLICTIVQWRRGRRASVEQIMGCLSLSGVLTTLTVIISQTLVRHADYTLSDLPLTICCAISGCALPAFAFSMLRRLIENISGGIEYEKSKDWETVKGDVLSLTGFGKDR